jgi:putative methanogenesis marker protein 6
MMAVQNDKVQEDVITKMVVISDSLLPAEVAISAYKITSDVVVKETCYGLMITGKRSEVDRLASELRNENPHKIFIKERGYPSGDKRRCRADRGGGPRPGFHQLKEELEILPDIAKGLVLVERGFTPVPQPRPKNIDVDKFKEIINSTIAEGDAQ